jgi:MFS transporter, CP family, cyanate transporter
MTDDHTSAEAAASSHPHRWVMLASIAFLYACFGLTVVSLAPLVGPIRQDLGLTNSEFGSVMGAWPLVYIFFAVPCGALLDRVGARRAIGLGCVGVALSLAMRSIATDHLSLFLAVAVFGVCGPLVSVGAPKVIAQWFSGKDRGFAMGIYFAGNSIGIIAALSLTNSVAMPLAGGNWRTVLLCYAGLVLTSGVLWLIASSHRASRELESEFAAEPRRSQFSVFGELLSLPAIRIILVMSVGMFFFNHSLNNWLPEILRDGGMDAVTAGYWSSIPTLVGIAAALTIPRMAIPERRYAILAILILSGMTASLLLHMEQGGGLVLGLLLQGLTRGTIGSIVVLILMETKGVGSRAMGAAAGLYFSVGEVGGVLGPLTVGMLSDFTGGFSAPLFLLTGVTGFMFVMLGLLWRINRNAIAVD